MYYRLKYGKYYLIKIIILFLASLFAEYIIWWAMIREESVNWLAGHVVHPVPPYTISKIEDGQTVVANVVKGFEITVPANWEVEKTRHPYFSLKNEKGLICEIKSEVKEYDQQINVNKLLSKNDNGFIQTLAGRVPAVKKEQALEGGNYIYSLEIPIDGFIIEYKLLANQENKDICCREFEQIKRSFI